MPIPDQALAPYDLLAPGDASTFIVAPFDPPDPDANTATAATAATFDPPDPVLA